MSAKNKYFFNDDFMMSIIRSVHHTNTFYYVPFTRH